MLKNNITFRPFCKETDEEIIANKWFSGPKGRLAEEMLDFGGYWDFAAVAYNNKLKKQNNSTPYEVINVVGEINHNLVGAMIVGVQNNEAYIHALLVDPYTSYKGVGSDFKEILINEPQKLGITLPFKKIIAHIFPDNEKSINMFTSASRGAVNQFVYDGSIPNGPLIFSCDVPEKSLSCDIAQTTSTLGEDN